MLETHPGPSNSSFQWQSVLPDVGPALTVVFVASGEGPILLRHTPILFWLVWCTPGLARYVDSCGGYVSGIQDTLLLWRWCVVYAPTKRDQYWYGFPGIFLHLRLIRGYGHAAGNWSKMASSCELHRWWYTSVDERTSASHTPILQVPRGPLVVFWSCFCRLSDWSKKQTIVCQRFSWWVHNWWKVVDKGEEQNGALNSALRYPRSHLLPQGHVAFCHEENSRSKRGDCHGFCSNYVFTGDVYGELLEGMEKSNKMTSICLPSDSPLANSWIVAISWVSYNLYPCPVSRHSSTFKTCLEHYCQGWRNFGR